MKRPKRKPNPLQPKSRRGFASFSPEKRKEIAARGYARTKAQGKIHVWTKEEASIAGKKSMGTLPPDHPSIYTKKEREYKELLETVKQFYKDRAKLFGRERNLFVGANAKYEKYPTEDEYKPDNEKGD